MKYKNVKTGVVIETTSKIIGEAWKLVTDEVKETAVGTETTEKYVEEEIDLGSMTKAELIELAKENDIEVNEKDKKEVIIETIAKAFE